MHDVKFILGTATIKELKLPDIPKKSSSFCLMDDYSLYGKEMIVQKIVYVFDETKENGVGIHVFLVEKH